MGMTFIYALCEPNSRTIRYIGKSNKPKCRLNEHLRHSVKKTSYLGNWLRSLKSCGERPNLVILCETPIDQWEIEERRYISSARMLGMRLVNATDGGDGLHNPSAETRVKMSIAHIGKTPTLETRAKLSAALKGEKSYMFGKTFTRESLAKMRATKKQRLTLQKA